MRVLPFIYLAYMFVFLYFLIFFLLIYVRNRKDLFSFEELGKHYGVSFVVPAYNEGETIGEALKAIFDIDYDNIIEVIVVNDCSTDNTREVVEKFKKVYPKIKLINNEKNLGNAAGSQNVGLRNARGELIAVVDADSYPSGDCLKKMVGYFDDPRVGVVTAPVYVRNNDKFLERLQYIEYKTIGFSRRLLDYVDGVYVTPGPLAVYRKTALDEIGGFDEKNLTQDIEATWSLAYYKWKRRMCLATQVTSTAPTKFKEWFSQRRRWLLGGLQCIKKHWKTMLNPKTGMLGMFIVPFFILGTFLGSVGLGVFIYIFSTRIISNFLYTRYSITANTPLVTLNDFYLTPSFLNYLGVLLFLFGLVFTFIILKVLKEKLLTKQRMFDLFFYVFVYNSLYPLILISSIWKLARGKMEWK
ncbi:hypothetical protein A3K73_03965 [Candidatus Pacearchaeota archaeon RBG_13_36_9]|nr:MAG: hypothetical protein A3K73_03965 [Candidatus Pacearchaeota archaeon RBG_13_36_9]